MVLDGNLANETAIPIEQGFKTCFVVITAHGEQGGPGLIN